MSEEENDNVFSGWNRAIIVAALLSGAGNGLSFLSSDTTDRYHADTARSDFSIRDRRLTELEREQHRHGTHAAKYTQIIDDLRVRLREHVREAH